MNAIARNIDENMFSLCTTFFDRLIFRQDYFTFSLVVISFVLFDEVLVKVELMITFKIGSGIYGFRYITLKIVTIDHNICIQTLIKRKYR